jgi:molecular chaperone DnaK
MVDEAADYEEEDSKRLAEAEARNKADSLVYQSEKLVKDLGEQIDANLRSKVESLIQDVKNSLTSGNVEEINSKCEELEKVTHELAQKLYAQQAAQQAQGAPGAGFQGAPGAGFQGAPGGTDDSEVVDVDYEIVDDE